ncbi:hypothetical protein GCM10027429_26200 [Marivirga atlantica]|jgi:uncharacterized Ntn-hydrolase superfamily protein|uniref:DUF1028 domain-containing protein n=1 Tax=Marivirga atlantica TaxID=1548457 RepID=A0A937DJQ2_9BACT|nr:DUF1028 domain-containing protein [Marivirga atlantica]MBL0766220.1 DUF1028 domain-containing protein [Marivirga atlantica]
MRKILSIILCTLISLNCLIAQKPSDPLAHTYSIVARDPDTGEIGVAVQSHWFSVGTAVSWAEAGVGAVATQSFTNVSFGPKGLSLMKSGLNPQKALDILLANDEGKDYRQVALINEKGEVATHTGEKCIDFASHLNGENFSVQANMMLNNTVVSAMEKAWKINEGVPLAKRMLIVLEAAQNQGGDIRGKQSAALLVVAPKSSDAPWEDRLVDLRVDDHENPLQELGRLLDVHEAYQYMNKGDVHVEKGEMKEAMQAYNSAMKIFPDNLEMQYWTAITLANDDKIEQAVHMLQSIYTKDSNWRELTKRLPKVGLLSVNESELSLLLK